ncbi:YdcF family protein [Stieleria sp. ICT_E10.1]|uniref:YdcF family protein n=1 Tax=Stieleria sedimenti TaxID=2976331 RepID=UPI00217FC0CA|nr:YdcF family protein [Stieleria sedimenti]MCS7471291.1 YdcF family protein [Stieleria sedimenti]
MESVEVPGHQQERSLQRREIGKSLAVGVFAAGMLAVSLVVATGIQAGRSPAERAATSLVMPIALIWLLLFAGTIACFVRRRVPLATLFAIAWLTVGIAFNGSVAGRFLRSLEYPAASDPAANLESTLDAVVLLGGYAADNRFDVPQLGNDGQRLLLAAQLWHAGKTKTLISTGTATGDARDPSLIGRELLTSIGVPDHVIFEVPGFNTDAEMVHLKAFFEDPPEAWLELVGWTRAPSDTDRQAGGPSIGLVTSAVHLSRAMRLADKRGLTFTPLGCDFNGRPAGRFEFRDLIPSSGAGKAFAVAFKEQLARIVGR